MVDIRGEAGMDTCKGLQGVVADLLSWAKVPPLKSVPSYFEQLVG